MSKAGGVIYSNDNINNKQRTELNELEKLVVEF